MDHPDDLRRALLALLPTLALADEAQGQDAAAIQPQSYRVAFENEHLRVLDHRSRPGMGVCGSGMHSHPAHLTIGLTAGRVRVKTPDGQVKVEDAPEMAIFWSEAETHEVENLSGRNMRALLIELKPGRR